MLRSFTGKLSAIGVATTALTAALLATPAQADETSGLPGLPNNLSAIAAERQEAAQARGTAPDSMIMVGGGVMVAPRYSGSSAFKTTAIPFVAAEADLAPSHHVYLRGLTAGYEYQYADRIIVGADARYRMERDTDDDLELVGLPELDPTVEIGPRLRFQATPNVGVEGGVRFDVGDVHDGYEGYVKADYQQPCYLFGKQLRFEADVGATYGSEDFNNAYYGTTAAAGRPAFTADSGWKTVNLGLGVTHAVTQNWSVRGRFNNEVLIGDAADSPLVEADYQPSVMLGLAYRF